MKITSFFSGIFCFTAVFIALTSANALASGTVAVYTAAPQKLIDTLVPAFEKQSGIKVEIVKAGSGELLNRLRAEKGRQTADVIWSVGGELVDFNKELFISYTPESNDKINPLLRPSKTWLPFTAIVSVFLVNNQQLKGANVPKSWSDLTKSTYKGRVSSARADKSGSSYIQLATVLQIYGDNDKGWNTYQNMMANMVLSNSSGAVPRFVNDGEAAVGITLEDAALRYKLGGGPVQIVYPSDGTSLVPDAMALVANGPNPSAGKKFLDYMISKEAQSSVAAIGRRPVRVDVESVKELTPLNQIKTIQYDLLWAVENKKRLVERWNDTLLEVQ
jgi:iron(III) transport system substrate-binding protein